MKTNTDCSGVNMRYYWEVLFSTEYFPYWEFTMLMMLALNLSILLRIHNIQEDVKDLWANTFYDTKPRKSFWQTIRDIYNADN